MLSILVEAIYIIGLFPASNQKFVFFIYFSYYSYRGSDLDFFD